jgi:hypothetical protein
MRISGCRSEVATITTERRSPSGPRFFSTNSRTSRPRSPMSPITFTSAFVNRAIMPMRMLFPTPDPERFPFLALAAGQQPVEAADPEVHGLRDPSPLQGVDRLCVRG